MFKKYTPDDYDKHGYFKPPVGFYLLLVLLMRAYIIWILSVANRQDGTALIQALYPNKLDFFIGLGVGVGALLVMVMSSLRRDQAFNWLPSVWKHGKWLLWCSWLADVLLTLWLIKANHFKFAPEHALTMLALFFAGLYMLRSSRISDLFKDWPLESLKGYQKPQSEND